MYKASLLCRIEMTSLLGTRPVRAVSVYYWDHLGDASQCYDTSYLILRRPQGASFITAKFEAETERKTTTMRT